MNNALLLTVTVLTILLVALGVRLALVILRRRRNQKPPREPDLLFDTLQEQTRRERVAEAQRRETAAALEALDALYRTVMQHLPLGVLVLDQEGIIQFANPWLIDSLEIDSIVDQPLRTVSRALSDCLETMDSEAELELVLAGKTRVLRVSRTAMEGQTLITLVDETRLRKLEDRVRVKRDLELMGELAGGVTHEVKNTLATIRGLIQLLPHSEIGEMEPKLLEEVDHLNRFVRQLTRSSRAGQPEMVPLPLKSWLQSQKSRWQQWEHGGQILLEEVDPDLEIRADATMIASVLDNLVRNGLEACMSIASEPPWVVVSVRAYHETVDIVVSDRGPGFAEHVRDRLFVPFVTAKPDGTGLGLFQCRKIMLEHGGSLSLELDLPTRLVCSFPLIEDLQH